MKRRLWQDAGVANPIVGKDSVNPLGWPGDDRRFRDAVHAHGKTDLKAESDAVRRSPAMSR
jgi:hypothetical protein